MSKINRCNGCCGQIELDAALRETLCLECRMNTFEEVLTYKSPNHLIVEHCYDICGEDNHFDKVLTFLVNLFGEEYDSYFDAQRAAFKFFDDYEYEITGRL